MVGKTSCGISRSYSPQARILLGSNVVCKLESSMETKSDVNTRQKTCCLHQTRCGLHAFSPLVTSQQLTYKHVLQNAEAGSTAPFRPPVPQPQADAAGLAAPAPPRSNVPDETKTSVVTATAQTPVAEDPTPVCPLESNFRSSHCINICIVS